jgi:hypothetical protein
MKKIYEYFYPPKKKNEIETIIKQNLNREDDIEKYFDIRKIIEIKSDSKKTEFQFIEEELEIIIIHFPMLYSKSFTIQQEGSIEKIVEDKQTQLYVYHCDPSKNKYNIKIDYLETLKYTGFYFKLYTFCYNKKPKKFEIHSQPNYETKIVLEDTISVLSETVIDIFDTTKNEKKTIKGNKNEINYKFIRNHNYEIKYYVKNNSNKKKSEYSDTIQYIFLKNIKYKEIRQHNNGINLKINLESFDDLDIKLLIKRENQTNYLSIPFKLIPEKKHLISNFMIYSQYNFINNENYQYKLIIDDVLMIDRSIMPVISKSTKKIMMENNNMIIFNDENENKFEFINDNIFYYRSKTFMMGCYIDNILNGFFLI